MATPSISFVGTMAFGDLRACEAPIGHCSDELAGRCESVNGHARGNAAYEDPIEPYIDRADRTVVAQCLWLDSAFEPRNCWESYRYYKWPAGQRGHCAGFLARSSGWGGLQ